MSEKEEYYRRKIGKEGRREKQRAERLFSRIKDPSFVIQFFLVLCTGGLILVGYFQYLILNKTDQTLRAVQRPWISAKLEITSDFVSDDKEAALAFRYTFKNVGNSPALNVFGFARIEPNIQDVVGLAVSPLFHTDPPKELKDHCAEITKLTTGVADNLGSFFGDVIFPGDSVIVDDRGTIDRSKEVINPFPLTSARPQRKFTAPILITFCVDYQASLEPSHHQTAHAYYLTRKSEGAQGGIIYVDPGEPGTTPAAELGLGAPTIYGNQYAN